MALHQDIGRMVRGMTCRNYQIDWSKLDNQSQREVIRMLRDLEYEKLRDVRIAKTMPWRRA